MNCLYREIKVRKRGKKCKKEYKAPPAMAKSYRVNCKYFPLDIAMRVHSIGTHRHIVYDDDTQEWFAQHCPFPFQCSRVAPFNLYRWLKY